MDPSEEFDKINLENEVLREQNFAMNATIIKMTHALNSAKTGLADWLTTHAPEECSELRVRKAKERIQELGTIGYIAGIIRQIKLALDFTDTTQRDK